MELNIEVEVIDKTKVTIVNGVVIHDQTELISALIGIETGGNLSETEDARVKVLMQCIAFSVRSLTPENPQDLFVHLMRCYAKDSNSEAVGLFINNIVEVAIVMAKKMRDEE